MLIPIRKCTKIRVKTSMYIYEEFPYTHSTGNWYCMPIIEEKLKGEQQTERRLNLF